MQYEPMQAKIIVRADFRRDSPEYRKPRPGTMTMTIAEAMMIYAWSPDWYHWLTFSVPMSVVSMAQVYQNGQDALESPPRALLVPLNSVGGPTHAYDMTRVLLGLRVSGGVVREKSDVGPDLKVGYQKLNDPSMSCTDK